MATIFLLNGNGWASGNYPLVDESGNGHRLSYYSTGTSPRFVTSPTGKYGNSCLDLETGITTQQLISWPYNPVMNLSGDFTVECWVFLPLAAQSFNARVIFGSRNASKGFSLWLWQITGNIAFFDNEAGLIDGGTPLPTQQWSYATWTRSGTTLRMFVQGNLVSTSTVSVDLTKHLSYEWGGITAVGSANADAYFNGIRISDECLYTANFTPPTNPFPETPVPSPATTKTELLADRILAYYGDDDSDSTLSDEIGSNDLTLSNASDWVYDNSINRYALCRTKASSGGVLATQSNATWFANLINGATNCTVHCWVPATQYSAITASHAVLYGSIFGLRIVNTTSITANRSAVGFWNTNAVTLTATADTLRRWLPMTMIRHKDNFHFYVDGNYVGANTASALATGQTLIFNEFAEMTVWNKNLKPYQIDWLANPANSLSNRGGFQAGSAKLPGWNRSNWR